MPFKKRFGLLQIGKPLVYGSGITADLFFGPGWAEPLGENATDFSHSYCIILFFSGHSLSNLDVSVD
jgi:hypothetical protein